jgi:hypothetical protein
MTVPKKAKAAAAPKFSLLASRFGGEVAETCIPQIRPVVEALPPEDTYAFWYGLIVAFAAFADASMPPTGPRSAEVLQRVIENLPTKRSTSLGKLN